MLMKIQFIWKITKKIGFKLFIISVDLIVPNFEWYP